MESYLLITFLLTPIHTLPADALQMPEIQQTSALIFGFFSIITYVYYFSKICKQTSYIILAFYAKQRVSLFASFLNNFVHVINAKYSTL
jgi:hypothetical protein